MAIVTADSILKWIQYLLVFKFINAARLRNFKDFYKLQQKSLPAIDIKTQCSSGF